MATSDGEESFPSLWEVVADGKPKKKKQALLFFKFSTGVYVGPGEWTRDGRVVAALVSKDLRAEEMLMFPTGPRERSNIG